jgi:hypothetical protein
LQTLKSQRHPVGDASPWQIHVLGNERCPRLVYNRCTRRLTTVGGCAIVYPACRQRLQFPSEHTGVVTGLDGSNDRFTLGMSGHRCSFTTQADSDLHAVADLGSPAWSISSLYRGKSNAACATCATAANASCTDCLGSIQLVYTEEYFAVMPSPMLCLKVSTVEHTEDAFCAETVTSDWLQF